MSNIDKLMEKLKSAALKLNCEQWQTRNGFSGVEVIVKGSVVKGHGCVSYQPVASELVDTKTAKAIALFCPANILALLDELEAKDKSIGFLKDQLAQLANFNPDWDKLEAATDSLREHMAKLSSAEKRIAELEAREVVLPSAHDVHPLGPQSVKIFCEFHRSIVNRCADEIRKVGVKVSIKGN